jgi:tetraprenyl-beta-curcumene synthase
LFWTLPSQPSVPLLRALVAFQTIWDFLDSVTERWPDDGGRDARQLHLALADAVSPATPLSDYYRYHGGNGDGGYLSTLVSTCRTCCLRLPGFGLVAASTREAAGNSVIQALNHEPDATKRETGLKAHAFGGNARESRVAGMTWFEVTAASSASLVPHALLSLAAEPVISASEVRSVTDAYSPWVGLTTAMLDSLVDLRDDVGTFAHSYVAHYGDLSMAERHLRRAIRCARENTRALPYGHRHEVVVGSMIAMYLTRSSASEPDIAPIVNQLIRTSGPVVQLLVPLVRAWRLVYHRNDS